MKVLLYLEAENFLGKSGIGHAIKHQERTLAMVGQGYTTNPKDDYDSVYINTYGLKNWYLLVKPKRAGKKVLMHGHPAEENFRDSFVSSDLVSPIFRWYLCRFYQKADAIITPTEYSESLIASYGIKHPICVISNGTDLSHYVPDFAKEETFRRYFDIKPDERVVVCAGFYFMRKDIDELVKVVEQMPDVRFTWFGGTNKWVVPRKVRSIVVHKHPSNMAFADYIKGSVSEGAASGTDAFFFPSHEETEEIVVLGALASHQHVVLRGIPVHHGWVDESCAKLATDVDGFVEALREASVGKGQEQEAGYKAAKSRSIDKVVHELVDVYERIMEL